ncbi:MAG: pilus assembly protein TadG-related protein [Xanthomonadales bacterium]|nr:pilus assembly protein TadG-related protein [Xanthomonadales bacterium]
MIKIYDMRKQRGYAAVLLVVLIGVMGLSTITLYNSGQLTSSKMRQQNAADAAAYSVATIISRDLNFIAYTNRAMVANQVAIGQMTGIASWMKYIRQMSGNLQRVTSWIPYVGAATTALNQAMAIAEQAVEVFTKAMIIGADGVITGLGLAQSTLHVALQGAAVQVYEAVATKNDPDVNIVSGLTAASLAKSYISLDSKLHRTKKPKRGTSARAVKDLERYDEFAEIVSNSRDQFTQRRAWSVRVPLPIPLTRFRANKVGGSNFERVQVNGNEYGWNWSAMDTLGINIDVYGPNWRGRWRWRSIANLPIGWGAAHSLNKDKPGNSYNYFSTGGRLYGAEKGCRNVRCRWGNGAWSNRWPAWFAAIDDRNNLVRNIRTLQQFYTIKDRGAAFVGPQITVLLEKPLRAANDETRLWGQVLQDNGKSAQPRFDVEAGSNVNTMFAFSKAETYFMRPVDTKASPFWRRDGKIEYGNLYNPYWQPKLIDPG